MTERDYEEEMLEEVEPLPEDCIPLLEDEDLDLESLIPPLELEDFDWED